MAVTEERRRRILEAALAVFLRHGYRKVTMEDIARGVGISRPALYLAYPGKEAVFRDVVQVGLQAMLEEMERGLEDQPSLEAQLLHVFRVSSLRSYQQVASAPAAGELLTASFDFVQDVFDEFDRRKVALLARLIRAAVPEPDALQPTALARARVVAAATHGFKTAARDARDLEGLLRDLARMTVAGLPGAGRRRPPRRS